MPKYSSLSVRVETAARLKSKMKYGESIDSFINYLLDQIKPGIVSPAQTYNPSI